MEDLFADLESMLSPEPELSPADKLVIEQRERIANLRKKEQPVIEDVFIPERESKTPVLDAYESHRKANPDVHTPFKEFRDEMYQPKYYRGSMPPGLRELQDMNGVNTQFVDEIQKVIDNVFPQHKKEELINSMFNGDFTLSTIDESTGKIDVTTKPATELYPPTPIDWPDWGEPTGFVVEAEQEDKGQVDLFADETKEIADEFHKEMENIAVHYDKLAFPELIQEMVNIPPAPFGIKTKAWLGIDPGKSGAIVVITEHGDLVSKSIMPTLGSDIDLGALYNIFIGLNDKYNITVVLEDVHSIFNVSASANFTFGFVCGAIEAIVIAHKMKLIKISPKVWQNEIWQNSDKQYQPLKEGQKNPSINTKLTSLIAAKRLFPNFDFRKSDRARVKNDHDGIVDASLLAEYGRRKNL